MASLSKLRKPLQREKIRWLLRKIKCFTFVKSHGLFIVRSYSWCFAWCYRVYVCTVTPRKDTTFGYMDYEKKHNMDYEKKHIMDYEKKHIMDYEKKHIMDYEKKRTMDYEKKRTVDYEKKRTMDYEKKRTMDYEKKRNMDYEKKQSSIQDS
ncbi:unnamed protein product [Xylocopa violacea]|uniref:Uncharacterized protein n=1 Tax=Xylocopa violacea TaxID=135666 RepID=A0ABP1NZZ1_XYLVO